MRYVAVVLLFCFEGLSNQIYSCLVGEHFRPQYVRRPAALQLAV
jgi:hypothetical protein